MRCFALALALGLSIALSPATAAAQTTADNLQKYIALRKRLTSEFSVVGTGPGESQPGQERKDSEGWMKWGDSTIFLGFYIGSLATEHYLLTHPSEFPGADAGDSGAAAKTKTELYDALFALERLDEVADASFPPPCTQTPSVNGFFIRDDVPQDFYQHFAGLTTIYSDFVDPALTNKEMSQDQVYHLLSGLALVKKLIPKGTLEGGKDLNAWAVEQARRIIEHVSKDNWVIKNPACGDRNVNRGPLASGFSGGTRQAIAFITDGAFMPDTAESLIGVWDSFKVPSSAIYIDVDNLHMALAIAAVGNGWGDETANAMAALAKTQDWPLYPLLHRVLHGDDAVGWCLTAKDVNALAKSQLDELPKDAEPASPRPGTAVHGWTSTNRYIRGKDHAYVGAEGSDGRRYSGLDYLLLFGLYAIATPATWEGGNGAGIPKCTVPSKDGGSEAGTSPTKDESEDSGCGCRVRNDASSSAARFVTLLAMFFTALRRSRARSRRSASVASDR